MAPKIATRKRAGASHRDELEDVTDSAGNHGGARPRKREKKNNSGASSSSSTNRLQKEEHSDPSTSSSSASSADWRRARTQCPACIEGKVNDPSSHTWESGCLQYALHQRLHIGKTPVASCRLCQESVVTECKVVSAEAEILARLPVDCFCCNPPSQSDLPMFEGLSVATMLQTMKHSWVEGICRQFDEHFEQHINEESKANCKLCRDEKAFFSSRNCKNEAKFAEALVQLEVQRDIHEQQHQQIPDLRGCPFCREGLGPSTSSASTRSKERKEVEKARKLLKNWTSFKNCTKSCKENGVHSCGEGCEIYEIHEAEHGLVADTANCPICILEDYDIRNFDFLLQKAQIEEQQPKESGPSLLSGSGTSLPIKRVTKEMDKKWNAGLNKRILIAIANRMRIKSVEDPTIYEELRKEFNQSKWSTLTLAKGDELSRAKVHLLVSYWTNFKEAAREMEMLDEEFGGVGADDQTNIKMLKEQAVPEDPVYEATKKEAAQMWQLDDKKLLVDIVIRRMKATNANKRLWNDIRSQFNESKQKTFFLEPYGIFQQQADAFIRRFIVELQKRLAQAGADDGDNEKVARKKLLVDDDMYNSISMDPRVTQYSRKTEYSYSYQMKLQREAPCALDPGRMQEIRDLVALLRQHLSPSTRRYKDENVVDTKNLEPYLKDVIKVQPLDGFVAAATADDFDGVDDIMDEEERAKQLRVRRRIREAEYLLSEGMITVNEFERVSREEWASEGYLTRCANCIENPNYAAEMQAAQGIDDSDVKGGDWGGVFGIHSAVQAPETIDLM